MFFHSLWPQTIQDFRGSPLFLVLFFLFASIFLFWIRDTSYRADLASIQLSSQYSQYSVRCYQDIFHHLQSIGLSALNTLLKGLPPCFWVEHDDRFVLRVSAVTLLTSNPLATFQMLTLFISFNYFSRNSGETMFHFFGAFTLPKIHCTTFMEYMA